MKQLIIIFTIIIVANLTGFGPTVCNAQLGGEAPLPEIKKTTGPSLEETTKWITEKFASLSPKKTGLGFHRYLVTFDDCEMTSTHVNDTYVEDISYFQLREIDENAIKVSHLRDVFPVRLYVLGKIKAIRIINLTFTHATLNDMPEVLKYFPIKGDNKQFMSDDSNITLRGSKIIADRKEDNTLGYLSFTEIEDAESMANAFKHAVVLCRQKDIDKKAAQPAKKKDLF